jgi:hypothetical protein
LAFAAAGHGAGSLFKSLSGSAPVANAADAVTDSASATAIIAVILHALAIKQP